MLKSQWDAGLSVPRFPSSEADVGTECTHVPTSQGQGLAWRRAQAVVSLTLICPVQPASGPQEGLSHAHARTRTDTRMHTRAQTHVHAHMHTHGHMYMHARTHADTHTWKR